jgi:hypothetical protein
VGNGFASEIFVGRASSTIGVEGRLSGDGSTAVFLATCFFAGAVFGLDFAGVAFLGVAGLGAGIGDDARRFAADSRRSRAGRTRFWGATSAIVELLERLNCTCK